MQRSERMTRKIKYEKKKDEGRKEGKSGKREPDDKERK